MVLNKNMVGCGCCGQSGVIQSSPFMGAADHCRLVSSYLDLYPVDSIPNLQPKITIQGLTAAQVNIYSPPSPPYLNANFSVFNGTELILSIVPSYNGMRFQYSNGMRFQYSGNLEMVGGDYVLGMVVVAWVTYPFIIDQTIYSYFPSSPTVENNGYWKGYYPKFNALFGGLGDEVESSELIIQPHDYELYWYIQLVNTVGATLPGYWGYFAGREYWQNGNKLYSDYVNKGAAPNNLTPFPQNPCLGASLQWNLP